MPEQLREGAGHYEEARCSLPGCGEPLHITWTGSRAIYLDDTADMIRDPAGALTTSWQIGCEGGHVILLPPDTAEDSYEFACLCVCNPDYPDPEAERMCPHNDMDRLRAVLLAPEAATDG